MPRALTALAFVMVMTLACSDSPQPPTTPSTPTTVTPTVPPVREVTIIGAPANVQIGDTAQLRAISRADDGGLQDVSQLATWRSTDDTICRVNGAGVVEGRGAGSATLTASYSGTSGTATVICGYVISAQVHENAPTTHVVVPNARVEVEGGALNGRSFEADASGRVTLPPVAGPGFALKFKRRDYDDYRLSIVELPRQTAVDVGLMPAADVRFEDGGTCTGSSFDQDIYVFTARRESRMRFWAEGPLGFTYLCVHLAWIDPQGRSRNIGCDNRVPLEMVGPPATYTLNYRRISCPAGAPWRIVMEHAR